MTTDICPVPSSDDKPKDESQRDAGPNGHDARSRRSGGDAIPSREECLKRIDGLTGLVALRIFAPRKPIRFAPILWKLFVPMIAPNKGIPRSLQTLTF